MLRVLRYGRRLLFLHRKSNHIFILWQHMVLLVIRQYEGKSYRMFSEWLVEAYYLNISPIITYTSFYYSPEIHRKNQWNSARKDNFIIHNPYKNQKTIHWNRFIWIQSNPCFSVLRRKSQITKKINQAIIRSRRTTTDTYSML